MLRALCNDIRRQQVASLADWARAQAMPSDEEIHRIRRLIE